MTIKELEQLSGLTRSNIRFYEEKGLIVSKVLENGYHDYSMDNLNDLKAIKLLRSLGISIEEISKIKMNQLSLVESVEKNMNHLSAEKQQADHSLQISQKIIEENYSFADLGQNDIFVIETPKELEQDTLVIPNPWIRFFAREIDGWLCGIVLMAILHYVFLSPLTYRNTIMTAIAGAIIQLVLEPFFIAYLATTPGKWAFGIYVYGFDHKKLSLLQAINRTLAVSMFGTCFNIPVLSLAMEFRCYKKLNKKEPLVWEDDSLLVQNINGLFSAVKVSGIIGLSVLCMIGVAKDSLKPNNREGVTIEQFAENYNYLYETYGFENGVWDPIQLNEDGTWERTHTYPDGSIGEIAEVKYYKDFVYEIKEGKVVKIEWNHALPDVGASEGGSKEILLTCLALIEGNGGLQKNTDQFISELMNQMMQSFELYQDGYKITYELKEHTNLDYIQSSGIWFCTNNESGSLEFNFSIVKID